MSADERFESSDGGEFVSEWTVGFFFWMDGFGDRMRVGRS